MAELKASTDIDDAERAQLKMQLALEFGRRSKRALDKAKRDNTIPKVVERAFRASREFSDSGAGTD